MNTQYFKEYSHNLGRDMEFKVYGSDGKPVLAFPSQSGRFYDFENNGMIDCIKDYIEAGRIQVFCCDCNDDNSWSSMNPDQRARIEAQEAYVRYITEELVPRIMEAGFDGFLSKPIASDKLEAALREYLPKDKIKQTDSYENGSDTSYEEEFPSIFGIDWDIAMMRMHDKRTVRSVLDSFFVTLDQQADKLQRFMEGLPDTLNDYRIMVHGMKSASGYIGILPLTGMAAVLEKASSEGDMETVNRLHQVFIREWKSYRERLAEYMGIGEIDDNEKEEISEDALKMLLNILSKSMEEMDIDGADKAMDKLLSYRLPDSVSGKMEALKIAVAELNQEETDRIISVINGIV